MMWGWGTGGWFGALWMVLFWVAVVLLIVWTVRAFSSGSPPSRRSALEILEERFARGEIDASEFEERRRRLTDHDPVL